MDLNQQRKERIQLFKDAVRKEKIPARVPQAGNLWSWKVLDAGYKLSEALFDYDIMEKVMRHSFEKYDLDGYYDLGTRNPFSVTSMIGNAEYIIDDDAGSLNIKDQCFMNVEDYDALIADSKKFFWEIFIPRKNNKLQKKENSADLKKAIAEFGRYGQYLQNITKIMNEEYGIPTFSDTASGISTINSYEILFNFLRGIIGLSYDMRRNMPKVIDAIKSLDDFFINPSMEFAASLPKGSNPEVSIDAFTAMLGHTILNVKQFETVYWPFMERLGKFAQKQDKLIGLFCEGDSERFYDFFRELPKGHFYIHPEQNDIFKMKKALPNIAIAGGMPVDLLGKDSKQKCVDYAKMLIEELGSDGGYIFSSNKMISFTYDCNSENLKAVSDLVKNYMKITV